MMTSWTLKDICWKVGCRFSICGCARFTDPWATHESRCSFIVEDVAVSIIGFGRNVPALKQASALNLDGST